MNIFDCYPIFGFVKEEDDEHKHTLALKARIEDWLAFREREEQKPYEFHSSRFETDEKQLLRILRRCKFNVESSFQEWVEWVTWREEIEANAISEKDFEPHLTPLGIAAWRGKDKGGSPCLVLTGRLLRSDFKFRSGKLFKRYLVHMVEKGVHLCNELNLEHACVLYDRRMLDYQHCDSELHNACKPLFHKIRQFYGDRIGNIYILNMNWMFYHVFTFVLAPLVGIFRKAESMNLYAVQTAKELDEWFDTNDLLLDNTLLEGEPVHMMVETEEIVVDEQYDIRTEGIRLPGGTIMTGIPPESISNAAPRSLPT